jgi:FkbM family methyltransferase
VFDVGANAGQYADLLRNEVGYRGPLCSVEPIPAVALALAQRASTDAKWTVHTLALGRERGRAQFNVMAGSEFSSFKAPDAAFEGRFQGQHRIEQVLDVEVETLDGLVQRIGLTGTDRSVYLKLDTQGTELDVLAGAQALLPRVAAIQTEIGLKTIYAGAPSAQAVMAHVQSLGFELAALFPNNEGHFPRLLELDAIFIHGSLLPAFD